MVYLSPNTAEFTALSGMDKAALLGELLEALKTCQDDLPEMCDAAVLKQGHKSVDEESAITPWCLEQLLLVQYFSVASA